MDGLFALILALLLVLSGPYLEHLGLCFLENRKPNLQVRYFTPWNFTHLLFGVLVVFLLYQQKHLTVLLAVMVPMLLVLARTDLKVRMVPDHFLMPMVLVTLVWQLVSASRTVESALLHMVLPGVLMVITLYGNWAIRRFAEPRYPDYPMSYMQVGVATLVGYFNLWAGLAVFAVLVLVNLKLRRVLHIPDFVVLPLIFLVGVYMMIEPGVLRYESAFAAAGFTTLVCAVYWWLIPEPDENLPYDPISFGFSDTKVLFVLALLLGFNQGFNMFLLAILIGIVVGIGYRLAKEKHVPFVPALVLAFLTTLFFPDFFKVFQF